MDHDELDVDSWLYEANRDLDDATAAEIDVETTLAQIKHRALRNTAEFPALRAMAEPTAAMSVEMSHYPISEGITVPSHFVTGATEQPRSQASSGPPSSLFGAPLANEGWTVPGAPLLDEPGGPRVDESGAMVRPYTKTGGRTRSDYDFAVEALVRTSERGMERGERMPPEHWAICRLCLDTRAVAEVAALLKMPIGVARVLIGDLVATGLVVVHNPPTDGPSTGLLERVRYGLVNLGSQQPAHDIPPPMDDEMDAPTEVLPVYEAVLSQWFESADSGSDEPQAKGTVLPTSTSGAPPPQRVQAPITNVRDRTPTPEEPPRHRRHADS